MGFESDKGEKSEKRNTFIRLIGVGSNPFDQRRIRYEALQLLGYPLEFRPDKNDPNREGYGYLGVYIDPSKKQVIEYFDYLIFLDGISQILGDIEEGRAHRLAKLVKGDEDDYYALSPQSPKGNNPGGRYQTDQVTLKQCYMRAYERYYEKVKTGTMYFPKEENIPYGPFTATPDESDIELYSRCEIEGLKPITSDTLVEMTKQIAEKILENQPRLKI